MFCYKCGKEISDNAKFCSKCGALQQITEIAPPPQENTEPTLAPEPTPIPVPTPIPIPVPAPAPQIIVNPIMLKLKTPYYWISKVCLALVLLCFFLPFVSGMDIERFFKDTSYSGFKLIQLGYDEYSNGEFNDVTILVLGPSFGIICSVLFALLFHKSQRFYEFIGTIFTIGMIFLINKDELTDIDTIYNLVGFESGFGLYIIIGLFVLAFIFATADKHVVKAQKKLEKLQESMTNTNQYQQL